MLAVEALPGVYFEERLAEEEAARRLAEQRQRDLFNSRPHDPLAGPRPHLPNPGSNTVLGHIFQGMVNRASSLSNSSPQEQKRAQTPVANTQEQAQKKTSG